MNPRDARIAEAQRIEDLIKDLRDATEKRVKAEVVASLEKSAHAGACVSDAEHEENLVEKSIMTAVLRMAQGLAVDGADYSEVA